MAAANHVCTILDTVANLPRSHWASNQVYVSNPNQIMVAYWSGDGDFSATLYDKKTAFLDVVASSEI